ncbi:MAG: phosphoglycolate phosphatase [Candidatus Hadarchaeales archaeon]
MIKILAVDIDGTITFDDRRLDLAAVEALRRAEASGMKVVLATGNIAEFAEAACVLIGTSGGFIAEDGGIVFDWETKEEILLGGRKEAEKGIIALREAFPWVVETRNSPKRLTGLTIERNISTEDAQKIFSERGLNLVAVDSGFAIHIKEPEINKGNALALLAVRKNIGMAEIAAIGDGPNDVEMLGRAGLSFAVGNSSEDARRIATYHLEESYGKGVAKAVEILLKMKE